MSKTRNTEASINISRPIALGEAQHMEFEHVTFDLPHGIFHALQGGDPDGQPTIVLHGLPAHLVNHLATMADLHRAGRYDRMSDDVLVLTGQAPLSMREFVSKNSPAFKS